MQCFSLPPMYIDIYFCKITFEKWFLFLVLLKHRLKPCVQSLISYTYLITKKKRGEKSVLFLLTCCNISFISLSVCLFLSHSLHLQADVFYYLEWNKLYIGSLLIFAFVRVYTIKWMRKKKRKERNNKINIIINFNFFLA